MPRFLAQIAPQQSTQYSDLTTTLAPYELQLCSLSGSLTVSSPIVLGDQTYVPFELASEPGDMERHELGQLATTASLFAYYDRIGEVEGPFLRPLETGVQPALPRTLASARRYRGKTNELFTHFMCNVARSSSALAGRTWDSLRILDPLAGGGTTLFIGLILGASVAGVEHRSQDVRSTAAFLRNFMQDQRIPCHEKTERFKNTGRRWVFTIGDTREQTCVLADGDTADSAQLITGFRPHLIVCDLPYGIQHKGELVSLLSTALPVWASLLPLGGALAFAWESTRFPRAEMIALVETTTPLTVLNTPPFDALSHRVDRVIKLRDIIVARPTEALLNEQTRAAG